MKEDAHTAKSLKRLFTNFTFMMVMRLVTAVLSFLLILYIARYWGAAYLGKFSILFAVFLFFQQMPLLGLHVAIIRDVAADPDNYRTTAINALVIAMCVSLFLFVIIGLGGGFVYRDVQDVHSALWLIAASIFPTSLIVVIESVLIGLEKTKTVAIFNIGENLIRTVPSIIAVFLGYGLTSIFVIFITGRLIMASAYLNYAGFYNVFRVPINQIRFLTIRNYIKLIPVFFGILAFSVLIERLDFFMLSMFADFKVVGLYSAPYKIYELGLMVPSLMMVIMIPVFSSCFNRSIPDFHRLMKNVFLFILIGWTPFIIIFSYHASLFMGFFGHEYQHTGIVLQLLISGIVFVGFGQLFSVGLFISHNQHIELKVLALACAIYALLLFIFIPLWGAVGAAIATLIEAIVHPLIVYPMARSSLAIHGYALPVFKTAVAAGGLALSMYVFQPLLGFFNMVPGIVIYLLVIIASKAVPASDIRNLFTVALEREAASE